MRNFMILALAACAGDDDAASPDKASTDTPVDGTEVCDDETDNNGDGFIDCADPLCDCPEIFCEDTVDNDLDGFVDCADPDCPSCPELCNGAANDEDGDGLADCADPDCTDLCAEFCTNTVDDDADELVDCLDDECFGVCDRDGDGYLGIDYGGDDCEDEDPAAHPGAATDPCGDGIDGDCVGGDPLCPPSTGDTSDTGTSPGDTSDTSDTGP